MCVFKFIYFNWKLINSQYCAVFLPYIDMNQPWMYICPTILKPLPTPLLWAVPEHQLWVPSSCVKFALFIYFTCAKIHFQYYSLISSHLRILPHSPKVCSLHLCLFCCLAYRVIVTVFLNSVCMC